MSKQAQKIYGIDLGTTYSSIAHVDEHGKAVLIPNAESSTSTPSVVFFDEDEIIVGDVAKESAALYPHDVVTFVKRSMGEPNFLFENKKQSYHAEEISNYIIRKIVQDARQNTGEKIEDIVITCPAYFGINEREATRKAGEIAGFNVHQIINEPTAAAISYGMAENDDERVVLVYDLGGGTFDITMIDIKPESIEVICTGGDHNLGGKDWDDRIVAYLAQEFQKDTGIKEDILEDATTCQDLQLSAERSKKMLTQRRKVPISVTHGGERVKIELEREKFEEITRDLMERTIAFTQDMLKEASKKGYDTFDEIILVGGSTRMPQVRTRVKKEFSKDPRIFDPDGAVAKGAAIYGWKLVLHDGLIRRIATKTQKSFTQIKTVMDESDSQTRRKLAQASGEEMPESAMVDITDVTSKSFGVIILTESDGERVSNIILKNTAVPASVKRSFYTAEKNQESVYIRVMESESSSDNIPPDYAVEIGTALLDLPRGLPVDLPIDIFFNLDKEGCLHIKAVESKENRRVNVSIETTSVIEGDALKLAKKRSQSLVVH
ncbi:Hsp70 family protein [Desulfococcaceae bacterium HSG7]|nr:Hsp70 family protein [Desulfococcaceae bacterium HSG7]